MSINVKVTSKVDLAEVRKLAAMIEGIADGLEKSLTVTHVRSAMERQIESGMAKNCAELARVILAECDDDRSCNNTF